MKLFNFINVNRTICTKDLLNEKYTIAEVEELVKQGLVTKPSPGVYKSTKCENGIGLTVCSCGMEYYELPGVTYLTNPETGHTSIYGKPYCRNCMLIISRVNRRDM